MSYTFSSPSQIAASSTSGATRSQLSSLELDIEGKREGLSPDIELSQLLPWEKVTEAPKQKAAPLNISSKEKAQTSPSLSSRQIVPLSLDSHQHQRSLQELMAKKAHYQKAASKGHFFPFLADLLESIEHQLKALHWGDSLAAEQFKKAEEHFEKLWHHQLEAAESIVHSWEHEFSVVIAKAKTYLKAGHRTRATPPPRTTKKTS
jgi:hypothetical protein